MHHDLSFVWHEQEDQHVEDVRDNIGSNSTTLVGCGTETLGKLMLCQSLARERSPSTFPSGEVEDYALPIAFQSSDYAHHSAGGNFATNS